MRLIDSSATASAGSVCSARSRAMFLRLVGAVCLAAVLASIFVLCAATIAFAGEFVICNRAGEQSHPKIAYGRVVYQDGSGRATNICLKDLASNSERVISGGSHWRQDAKVSNRYVTWNDDRDVQTQIYYQDFTIADTDHRLTGPTKSGSFQTYNDLSGDTVAFTTDLRLDAPVWGHYVYVQKPGGAATLLNSEAKIYDSLAFGGTWIVLDQRTEAYGNKNQVVAIPAAGGPKKMVSSHPGFDASKPDVWGSRVVYQDNRTGSYHIYMYDLSTSVERQISSGPGDQKLPAISGDIIVYSDHPLGYNHDAAGYVTAYDLRTGVTRRLTTTSSLYGAPDVWGNTVVWCDDRLSSASRPDILGYDLSVPDTFTKWTKRTSGTGESLLGVDMVGKNAWAVGYGGKILHSANAGATWAAQPSGVGAGYELWAVDFASASTGWVVGYDRPNNRAVILKTTNGGASWTPQSHPIPSGAWPTAVLAADPSRAFGFGGRSVVGQAIFYTENGGTKWTSHVFDPRMNVFGVSNPIGTGTTMIAWAVGWPNGVIKTQDGGASWYTVAHGGTGLERLHHAAFSSASTGIIVGDGKADDVSSGLIFRTVDGGANWSSPTPPTSNQLRGAKALGANIWIVGEGGTIDHSSDYGASWASQANPSGGLGIWDVAGNSSDQLVAVGLAGTILTGARPTATLTTPVVPKAKRNVSFTMYGFVKPQHPGYTRLYVQRFSRRWKAYKTYSAKNANYSSYTKYSLRLKLPYSGKWRVRSYHSDAGHQAGYSLWKTFTVR
jgi:beta propeller repeat protein